MRTGKLQLTQCFIVVLAALTIGVASAQASGQSPDSRPYYRGVEQALAPTSTSPDDRAYSRAIPMSSTTKVVSPDDRAFARSTLVEASAVPPSISAQPQGFDWGDALIGGTFGLVLALLLGAGAVAVALHHRRGALRTA
jgi:hypothetical protein